jgi:hypothetical protein
MCKIVIIWCLAFLAAVFFFVPSLFFFVVLALVGQGWARVGKGSLGRVAEFPKSCSAACAKVGPSHGCCWAVQEKYYHRGMQTFLPPKFEQ